MRTPSSGTGRWACSRTSGSSPARSRSRTRSPTRTASRWSAVATARLRSRSSGSRTASTTSRPEGAHRSSCSSSATSPVSLRCGRRAMPSDGPARKPLISGNWKMHLNHFEALQTVQKLHYKLTRADYDAVDVSVHPPFTDLRTVQTAIESDHMSLIIGAQHCHWEEKGAFTGEVSAAMLAKLQVRYVIVGHSERRQLFGETDEQVNAKVRAVLANGMTPIMCVGETLEEREAGDTESKVLGQLRA